MLGGSL